QSVQLGNHHVEDQQVEALGLGTRQRLSAVADAVAGVAFEAEVQADQFPNVGLVFDDKDAGTLGHFCLIASSSADATGLPRIFHNSCISPSSTVRPTLYSQNTNGAPGLFMGRRGGPEGPGFQGLRGTILGPIQMIASQLNLSDAQKDQIKAIAQSHRDEWQSLADHVGTARRGLRAAITRGTCDEALVRDKSAALGQAEEREGIRRSLSNSHAGAAGKAAVAAGRGAAAARAGRASARSRVVSPEKGSYPFFRASFEKKGVRPPFRPARFTGGRRSRRPSCG